ncbi:hypothetical protein [Pontibacillus sp. HMF3514]|uniref:hypothetical protein n=1 Tax=Pontibacillus sp. HMF3514 TaxID=2692425 RepID=UPI00131F66C8|nr:hypothetical protein [Pontibacillus sp. HMF3514]QHE51600.1 hypothetical protein GS400_05920 [Pontibacillus sp. HMF3514]
MKVNVLTLILLITTILVFGCSNHTVDKERLTILRNESKVIYPEEVPENFNALATQVCIENNQKGKASIDPFLVTFEIKDKLHSIVDESSSALELDSRYITNAGKEKITNLPPEGDTLCTGNTLMLKKEVSQDDLEKMVNDGDVKVSITELNGDVITSYTLQEFVIGKPDGSVIKP